MDRYRNHVALGILLGVAFALSATTFEARGGQGGNSAAAKRCQAEWQNLRTSDGQSFKNSGQCVSYAARGGQFGDASSVCEQLGGTVSTETRGGEEVLLCSGLPARFSQTDRFSPYCGTVTTEQRSGLT